MKYFDNASQTGDERVLVLSPLEFSVLRLALSSVAQGWTFNDPDNQADARRMADELESKRASTEGDESKDDTDD